MQYYNTTPQFLSKGVVLCQPGLFCKEETYDPMWKTLRNLEDVTTISVCVEIKQMLSKIPENITDFLDVAQIRVFGSYHYGTENYYSDIDFLIITDSKTSDNNLSRDLISKSFTDVFGNDIDIVAIDVNSDIDEFERAILIESTVIKKYRDIL